MSDQTAMAGDWHAIAVIWHAYLRWGITQGIEPPAGRKELVESGWLCAHEVPSDRCRPSPRCLAAVQEDVRGTVQEPPNAAVDSRAIMRIAPMGLLLYGCSVVEYAAQRAALTQRGAKTIAATSSYSGVAEPTGGRSGTLVRPGAHGYVPRPPGR